MPCAPMRIALCTARFMARRNEIRCASWLAMLSATSCASSSGRLISSTLMPTSLPVRCQGGNRSDESSVPLALSPRRGLRGLRDLWSFRSLFHLRDLLSDLDLDVARTLLNRRRASHRRGHETLELRAFVHDGARHVQRVDVEGRVVLTRRMLRVRHSRAQRLFDLLGGVLFREREVRERVVDSL